MFHSRSRVRAAALISTILALSACGGGGGGGGDTQAPARAPTPAPAPVPPITSFLANGKGGIGTATIEVDATGTFTEDDTRYQMQTGGTSGCSLSSRPSDPDVANCNLLAGGKGFLLCQNTTSDTFNVALFRQSDVQTAPLGELAGQTLTGISCGATGVSRNTNTWAFSADASIASEKRGAVTNNFGATASFVTDDGSLQSGARRERWAIYKAAVGSTTQYFLLDLFQNTDPSQPVQDVRIYFLQK
ncbi:hypothetical protein JJ685_14855 [Ramlibacter monticola]|uniref:DUF4360 domain-containing protein n=1 Tax=Ramlibacter monticola TaxID=1926872 RepID=A0A937CUX2_9BURK|nr:hypothetical protein [Ramlibacter monticola]MBL0392417.1 hypothetical protein [Ramlibacter monticola]